MFCINNLREVSTPVRASDFFAALSMIARAVECIHCSLYKLKSDLLGGCLFRPVFGLHKLLKTDTLALNVVESSAS